MTLRNSLALTCFSTMATILLAPLSQANPVPSNASPPSAASDAPATTPVTEGSAASSPATVPVTAKSESAPTSPQPVAQSSDASTSVVNSEPSVEPVRLVIIPSGDPKAPADGRSTVSVEGQLLDAAGNPIPQDAIVTLTATAGNFVGADQDIDRPGFQVLARAGKFTAQLKTSLQPQKVRIRAAVDLKDLKRVTPKRNGGLPLSPISLNNSASSNIEGAEPGSQMPLVPSQLVGQLEEYTQVEFTTNLRPMIVSGVINLRFGPSGTDYFGKLSDFLDPDRSGTRLDVNTAVFATGRLGDWLFTGALNNQRPLNQDCEGKTRLFRDVQSCDQAYPVYGDSSKTDYLTPSIDSVYLKFERTSPVPNAGTDYVMWGDYSTQEFSAASQLFTGTTRQLHGFKGNYNLGPLQLTGMYANNLEGFQRDNIAPNGTSGFYFLSRRNVVDGSERIFVETEEINRPGTVVERKQLYRGNDYEFDSDRGTIMFRRPIQQLEFDAFGKTLVRRIVATYQYDSPGNGSAELFGGRAQFNLSRTFGQESWVAATYLNEDNGGRTFELFGVDALIPFGKDGKVIAEAAQSKNDSIYRGNIKGMAYRVEIDSPITDSILGRAYYRSVDEDFANDATFGFTPGQTRLGAEVAAKVSDATTVRVGYDRESNYGFAPEVRTGLTDLFNPQPEARPGSRVDNRLTTFRAGVEHKLGKGLIGLDWVSRNRKDRITPERLGEDSNQLVSRFTYPLMKDLIFRAQNELNLGGDEDPLYPDRTTFALDWLAMPGVTLRLAHQFLSGGQYGNKTRSVTSFDTLWDYKLSEDTTVTGRYSVLGGLNGLTSQGALGLNHRWVVSPGLRFNFGYEHIFGNPFRYTAAGQQFAQPYAPSQSASSLGISSGDSFSVGVEYTDSPLFKASARVEHRTSSVADNTVISGALTGKISPSLTALVRYQQAGYANQTIGSLGDYINGKVGLAYRDPANDKLNLLFKYEYRQNPDANPDYFVVGAAKDDRTHLMSLEAIYAPSWRWEFYGKYAFKNTKTYTARSLANTNTISLGQLQATYRLGYRWDVTGGFRWMGQDLGGFNEIGFLTELGYYLTPNLRVAAGYSFGEAKDTDLGTRNRDGFYVGLSLKLSELLGGFGRQEVAPRQHKESLIKEPDAIVPAGTTPANLVPIPGTEASAPATAPVESSAPVFTQPDSTVAPVSRPPVRALY